MALYRKAPKNMLSSTDFVGWDNLGEEACEATHPDDLFVRMSDEDAAIFQSLAPGQAVLYGAFRYERD